MSTRAAYLFNEDKAYDTSYDVGDSVFQCGRRVDALKLWLTWRFRGDVGMGRYVDRAIATHRAFEAMILSDPRCVPVLPESSTVPCFCFWYVPEHLRRDTTARWTRADILRPDVSPEIDRVAPSAKVRLMNDAKAVLTMSRADGLPNFWRFVANGAVQWSSVQMRDFLDNLALAVEAEC